jgi:hypothetical protein
MKDTPMLFHVSDHETASRRLRRHVLTLLFAVACPGLAFAQDGRDRAATSNAAAGSAADSASQAVPTVESEPRFIQQSIDYATKVFGNGDSAAAPKNGFYVDFSNMITGSGLISAGPGYRHSVWDGKARIDVSAATSWHLYQMAQARLEFPEIASGHVTLGVQAMYRDATQVDYFGIGNDFNAIRSQYQLKTTDVVGYAAARPAEWLSVGAEFGWLKRPEISTASGTFNPGYPSSQIVYPTDPAMNLALQPNFLRSELSVMANTLDSRSHPTSGGLYRAAVNRYTDQDRGTFTFSQYEVEGVQMVPVVGSRLLLGLHAWTVFTDLSNGHQVPFYLMPTIGGNNTLRAFDDFQFHDLNTVVATAELRLALMTHVDLAGFYDAGNVASRYTDLNFGHTSIGAGLRLHTQRATFGRLDVAHGSEGWQFMFRTTDPFKLSRVTRRLAAIPFTP